MNPIIIIFSFFFLVLGCGIFRNWKVKKPKEFTYSILIACRNEERNLPNLFASLKKIIYPKDKFEIIIVDDASNDNSLFLMDEFCNKIKNAKRFHLEKKDTEYKGKKAALKKAVENAKYEIFIFTDADCTIQPEWLKSYNNYFSDKTGMVVGNYFEMNHNPFWKFSNQMSSTIYASTIGLGIPFSAAGGNLAVKKAAFLEVDGYEKIKYIEAGDDKLLLKLISRTRWQIAYNPEMQIHTINNKMEFHEQQKRKYGKFGMSSLLFKLFSILIFLFYIYLPINLIFFFDWKKPIIYLSCILFLWISSLVKHKYKFKLIHILFLIVYPYFLIYFSLLGTFGKWKWKSN